MKPVFVLTLGDVIGLVLLGLVLLVGGVAVFIAWINDATKGIFRNRK